MKQLVIAAAAATTILMTAPIKPATAQIELGLNPLPHVCVGLDCGHEHHRVIHEHRHVYAPERPRYVIPEHRHVIIQHEREHEYEGDDE